MATKTATKKPATKRVVKKKAEPIEADGLHTRAYVPKKEIAHRYVPRKVHGVIDATVADIAIRDGKNILLSGPTGAGKTLFGEAYAALRGLPYYRLPCDVSIDPSAFMGRMMPTEEVGKFRWQDGPLAEIVRHGGVFNISEVNMMTPKVAASLYSLLDGNRYIALLGNGGEVVRAHPDLLIIADMNPNYRGTMELNAAFKNRFDFKIDWDYSPEVEEKLIQFPSLASVAKRLRDMFGQEIFTPVSTNMMMEFEAFSLDPLLGVKFAMQNFLSAFDPGERDAVSKILDLNEANFTAERDTVLAGDSDEDDDDVQFIQIQQN